MHCVDHRFMHWIKAILRLKAGFLLLYFFVAFFKKEAKDSLLFSKELHYYLFSRHISTNRKDSSRSLWKKMTKKNSLLLCTSEK